MGQNRTAWKKNFFQNEYVGGFAKVIAGKEIIFLNLRFPVLNQDLKNLLYKISILLWCEQKDIPSTYISPIMGPDDRRSVS